ncbi:MAG: HAD-IA family hydrolase [Candidatus Hydrogenedentes bacterium]|nr:HAD-IA family hydrolase [Candidatus Hydrogenedentota bacterium]
MDAVIFDFDGLILDTETASYECWRETYAEHGLDLTLEQWAANIGGNGYHEFHPFETLERACTHVVDWETVHARRRARYHERVHQLECIPGVRGAIVEARKLGLKTAVASSSDCNWVHGHLKRLQLFSAFDAVRCGDQVHAIKPDPAVYQAALTALNLPPSRAFALEDSAKGVAAAKAAGLYCIAVANPVTRNLDLSQADRLVDSLREVSIRVLLEDMRGDLADAI